ncbi:MULTISPECIES: co-chaperone DjlA [Chromohalobacter]|uniref:Co-chaperone protein DjlA n=2 Tax=Chromohalobacter TaxID=42054 RepID=A0A1Q8TD18_9GAMM|nr:MULTISPECIES: co-chaperone DjlA [Chromohalobacter]MCK0753735.1 co-chaperone DjlA [Chromohalobacter japonicus]MCK0766493.1 co-chaperone DjlA [Chromohalobacter beijerinckii]MCK2043270.1 co-chaperone DjlA [Chromohalobacter moromii]MCT8515494.1 co-chaperone DjlA [Chromohalobacter sp. TMW 2.2271]OLO11554.1 molecular chaperone DjlA [Chromohalobacter japonicus]
MLIAILIGAGLGFMFGKLPGLIIGALLGYWVARRLVRRVVISKLSQMQGQFLDSTFAVMGCVCKADGHVSGDELRVVEALFERLRLNEEQRERAKAAFERGKADDFDLDAELATVRRVTGGQRALLQVFLQVQLSAIAADGELHPAEHDMLLRVARGLGCSEAEIEQIEAMLRGGQQQAGGGATSQQALTDAYRVLGVESDASDAELKRAYRRLMSQNHPDKLAGKGLPESMREMAETRTQEISNAYDLIKKSREANA